MAGSVTKVEAAYQVPFLAHATMEPMNCTVHLRKDGCEVWIGSQVVARAQAAAKTASLPLNKVVVHNHLIGGGFGRRLEIDGVIRAVQITQHVDGPVKVVWSREEDIGWGQPLPKRVGRGVSMQFVFATYMAQVAEIEVSTDGAVRVRRVVCAVDCGTVVNPDTVRAQIQGAIIFGITAALYGEITLKDGRVEQTNFDSYQILRMNEAPAIEVHIVQSSEPPGGMDETGTSAIVPAVINAIFAASGKRLRKLPIDTTQLKSS
jgi:CO/xanthine dehydrogenase Mo-binding subunit